MIHSISDAIGAAKCYLPDVTWFHFLQEKERKAHGEPGKTLMM